jgi:Beta-fructosidases (levanase/invertase)
MNSTIKSLLRFSAIVILLLNSSFLKSQQVFSFEGKDVLKSNNAELVFNLHCIRTQPELTLGITGNGLRTDGYSTWLDCKNERLQKLSGISGWFALESFPTDTAAFLSIKDGIANASIAVCVDRFGQLLIGYGLKNKFLYLSTNQSIEKFKWVNLAISTTKEGINFWVNGEKIIVNSPVVITPIKISELIIAKDVRDKREWMYDLTQINGIVDEIKLWNQPITDADLQPEVTKLSLKMPILAIPESRFKDDFSRPKYHLLPAANWTNETHGLIYYKNQYHIFNQKNASNLMLRQINWGHYSSPDLIHWTEHKPILRPEPGFDENGIWSGHVILNNQGIPAAFYSAGGAKFGIGMALPNDSNLLEWGKINGNPVIIGQPEGYTRTDMHDPYLWKVGDKWYMCIGFGLEKNGKQNGALLLYSSLDLKKWNFQHLLFEGNPEVDNSGVFWEMPVFQKIGEKYVLLVNKVPNKGVPARALYWVGDFVNEKFVPDNPIPKNLEVINRLLSPSVAFDKDGLLTAIAIIPDEFGGEATAKLGWTHLYSIPRVWTLKDGKILQSPHPVLKELREEKMLFLNQQVENEKPLLISSGHQQVEIEASIEPGSSKQFGFLISENPDHSEFTRIYYDTETREMVVDQAHSSLKEHIPLRTKRDKYDLDLSKPIDFHLFIDGSVIEIFVNEGDAFTTRIFPLKETSNQVKIFCEGGNINAKANVWILKPAKVKTDF